MDRLPWIWGCKYVWWGRKTLSSITKIEKGKYRVVVNKFGQRKLQKDGYTLKYELEQTELSIEGKSNAKEYAELILNNQ